MKKNHQIIYLCVVFLGTSLFPVRLYAQEVSFLEQALQEAQTGNPRIQAAYDRWKAAQEKVPQVKALADPMVNYTYFGEEIQTRVGPQEQKFGVSQKIPFPGKRHILGQAQKKEAAMFKEQYEATKREIFRRKDTFGKSGKGGPKKIRSE